MRRVFLPAVLFAFGASAASAQAADVTIQNFSFSPTPLTIAQGDTVTWHYAGPDTNHSVTADAGQADNWDSNPLGPPTAADHPPGSTFAHKFDVAGTFTYFCKVHSSMHGTVKVTAPGGGPPPDTTPPALTAITANGGQTCSKKARNCHARSTIIRFTLSEDAQIRLTAPGRPAATVARAATAGANTIKISPRKLPPGTYKLSLTATDAAGNHSPTAHPKVKVTRR